MTLSSWRRYRVVIMAALGCLLLAVVGLVALAKYEPGFYRQRAAPVATGAAGGGPDDQDANLQAAARRAVTKASAWHAGISRSGAWETALTDDEINAWLAVDLPRNHPGWLPRGVSQPRLLFRPRHVFMGTRVGYGPLTGVAWFDFEIVLRDVNHLAIAVDQARLGAIPLPRAPIVRELARRIRRLGMVTDLRMLDGKMMLMVYIPSTHDAGATSYWLEALSIGEGELLMAGETRSLAERAMPPTIPAS